MLVHLVILALLGFVTTDNLPNDWSCKVIDKVRAGLSNCATGNFDGSAWGVSFGANKQGEFCTVGLDGTGVEYGQNFFIRGNFHRPQEMVGPFVGLAYNMANVDQFNYIMLRFGMSGVNALEVGYNNKGDKQMAKQEADATIGTRNAELNVKLEVLVNKGEENIFIDGVHKPGVSSSEPHFATPGPLGLWIFGKGNPKWTFDVSGLEICHPHQCVADDGTVVQAGDSYVDSDGKTCTCSLTGFTCACPATDLTCGASLSVWTDPDTCISKCIPGYAECSSTGDPHYHTFDGKYYDFHGECTYQAASCEDFKVFFENYDLGAPAPRYTGQIKLDYKGERFVVKNNNVAEVNGAIVAVPYRKDYTDGSYVTIEYNGGLVCSLYSKGRSPSVSMVAQNAGSYINGYIRLHGSCADQTDGACGPWLNPEPHGNDGTINDYVDHFKEFDDKCPPPPVPYHPCDDIENGHERSAAICEAVLKSSPFTACHGVADPAQVVKTCQTDVCHCWIDEDCACSSYDSYASTCKNHGVNLDDWRNDVAYCPFNCPAGLAYSAAGPDPAPTCLNKNPVQTGTHRGCFCPTGQYFQDGVCVADDQCKCIHEGIIYNPDDSFTNEGKCLECVCANGGAMTCGDMVCAELVCDDDEITSYRDDKCCPYCNDEWVVAVNPENKINEGQDLTLTCDILAKGVAKKNIKWYKNGNVVKDTKQENISRNKRQLVIKGAAEANHAVYTCEAMLDGKVGKDDFNVEVVVAVKCTHEDGTVFNAGTVYNPTELIRCTCAASGVHTCECVEGEAVCKDTELEEINQQTCERTCVHKPGTCSAATDPHYTTFDGTTYNFQGLCIYKFFSGGGVEITADHEQDGTKAQGESAGTKSLDISFKTDTIHLGKGNEVLLNGGNVGVPFRKDFTDGSAIVITNTGHYNLKVISPEADPLVECSWDKVNTYTLTVHGSLLGQTDGLCGKWDDEPSNDMTDANGNVLDSIEDFAQSFSLEDEEDCPKPVPPPDMCEGMPDMRKEATTYCKQILAEGALGACGAVIDQSEVLEDCIQDSCTCWDVSCACSLIDVYADKCSAAGVDADNWRLDSKKSVCPPDCSSVPGTTYFAKGPKPAPTCGNPNPKGKRFQKGCFCPEGQLVEDGKCIDAADCRCEYAGIFYNSGDKYDKEGACKTCECKEGGVEKCTKIKCTTKCAKDEIKVQEDDQCCPVCYANWVTAVNPVNDVSVNDDVELTCKVSDGITVTAADVEWFKLDPLKPAKSLKKTKVSKDGLVLTLKDVNSWRTGDWKCVVSKDGKKAEGKFSVSTGIKQGELIRVEQDTWEFFEGAKQVTLKVKVEEGAKIKEMTWNCNGKELTNGDGKYSFKAARGGWKTLVISKPSAEDVGTCTATAHGVGEVDSETVNVKLQDVSVTLEPVTPVQCEENVKGCTIKCKITISDGSKLLKGNAWFSKVGDEDTQVKGRFFKGFYQKDLGSRKTPKTAAGEYFCKYTHKGTEYTSDEPVVVEMDEENTEVTLTPTATTVDCKAGQNCIIRCKYQFADGEKFKAANGKFYKKDGDKLGPAIASAWNKADGGTMMKNFGKKTKAAVAGDYLCRYTHKGTEYTSLEVITVNWAAKAKKTKKTKKRG